MNILKVSVSMLPLMILLCFGQAHAAQDHGWSVCGNFVKYANDKLQINEVVFEQVLSDIPRPEAQQVSQEFAAKIYFKLSLAGLKALDKDRWDSIKKSIDSIYSGQMKVKLLLVDVNNNGSIERVAEFRRGAPFTSVFNVVLNDQNELDVGFLRSSASADIIYGEIRLFSSSTYIFDVDPLSQSFYADSSSQSYPLKRNFRIYKPAVSAMKNNTGISSIGPNRLLCELEIIN